MAVFKKFLLFFFVFPAGLLFLIVVAAGMFLWLNQPEDLSPEECRQDAMCWATKHHAIASMRCMEVIEQEAEYGLDWTPKWYETEFDQVNWDDEEAGTLIYQGDELRFRRKDGSWQRMRYRCSFDPNTKIANLVFVRPT